MFSPIVHQTFILISSHWADRPRHPLRCDGGFCLCGGSGLPMILHPSSLSRSPQATHSSHLWQEVISCPILSKFTHASTGCSTPRLMAMLMARCRLWQIAIAFGMFGREICLTQQFGKQGYATRIELKEWLSKQQSYKCQYKYLPYRTPQVRKNSDCSHGRNR